MSVPEADLADINGKLDWLIAQALRRFVGRQVKVQQWEGGTHRVARMGMAVGVHDTSLVVQLDGRSYTVLVAYYDVETSDSGR